MKMLKGCELTVQASVIMARYGGMNDRRRVRYVGGVTHDGIVAGGIVDATVPLARKPVIGGEGNHTFQY